MPYPDSVAHRTGKALVDVDHTKVLDVGLASDPNGGQVRSDDGIVPHARVVPEGDVAQHDGPRRDKAVGSIKDLLAGARVE